MDFARYHSVLGSILLVYENNFIQHRSSMLDDRQYQATLGSLRFQCSLPGFRASCVQHADSMNSTATLPRLRLG